MLDILFVSDFVCPYCLVAEAALKKALELTSLPAQITWQPLELTMEPSPRVDTWNDLVRRSHYQVLVEPCRKLGLAMKLPPHVVPRPYTRPAIEAWYFAQEQGKGDAWKDAMYHAYFMEEKDIGEIDVLCEIAASLGMNASMLRVCLEDGVYTDAEREAVLYSRNVLKVKGVPTIYINGQQVEQEAYTVEEMAELLQAFASGENMTAEASGAAFHGCGPDGCC